MKKYKPNIVPLKTRAVLTLCVVLLLAFILAALAIGYTWIPGKRGGFLLSGIPTLMIVFSASALCVASLLSIIDHYDKRPNEASYKLIKRTCYTVSFFLFFAAPFVELTEWVLLQNGIDVFPKFHGIAERYTFYSPELKKLTRYIDPILNNGLLIGVMAGASCGIALFLDRLFPTRAKRLVAVLLSVGLLGLSSLWLANTTGDFLSGEVNTGRRSYRHTVRAENEPAKFNAILLTHFALGGVLFTAGTILFVGTVTNRIKPGISDKSHNRTRKGAPPVS